MTKLYPELYSNMKFLIEEIVLPEEIQKISATKIRAKMREEGKLK